MSFDVSCSSYEAYDKILYALKRICPQRRSKNEAIRKMSDVFTIVLFSVILFLFLFIAYGTGALDAYLKGYRVYSGTLDKQLLASDARTQETDPDDLLHKSWKGKDAQRYQMLYGCQGLKRIKRQRSYDLD